jgi:hypothetical protein
MYQPFQTNLVRNGRLFHGIQVTPEIKLSLQGHSGGYSEPQASVPGHLYTEMEMAIFINDEWGTLSLADQSSLNCHDEGIYSYGDGEYSGNTVFPYIPTATLQAVIDGIKAGTVSVLTMRESAIERGIKVAPEAPEASEWGGARSW